MNIFARVQPFDVKLNFVPGPVEIQPIVAAPGNAWLGYDVDDWLMTLRVAGTGRLHTRRMNASAKVIITPVLADSQAGISFTIDCGGLQLAALFRPDDWDKLLARGAMALDIVTDHEGRKEETSR